MEKRPFVFVDESGNFDFSPTGTAFYTFTSITERAPFPIHCELDELRFQLMHEDNVKTKFHASEDEQSVRDAVFSILGDHADSLAIDSVIIEKRKTGMSWQPYEVFYPKLLGQLIRYVAVRHSWRADDTPIFLTDEMPVRKRRQALKSAIKSTLASMMPDDVRYEVHHHPSMSNYGLQIADYCNWAIYRKWELGDTRSYDIVKTAIKSEFNIFETGTMFWY